MIASGTGLQVLKNTKINFVYVRLLKKIYTVIWLGKIKYCCKSVGIFLNSCKLDLVQ